MCHARLWVIADIDDCPGCAGLSPRLLHLLTSREEQMNARPVCAWFGGPDAALGSCCTAREIGWLPTITFHCGKLDPSKDGIIGCR